MRKILFATLASLMLVGAAENMTAQVRRGAVTSQQTDKSKSDNTSASSRSGNTAVVREPSIRRNPSRQNSESSVSRQNVQQQTSRSSVSRQNVQQQISRSSASNRNVRETVRPATSAVRQQTPQRTVRTAAPAATSRDNNQNLNTSRHTTTSSVQTRRPARQLRGNVSVSSPTKNTDRNTPATSRRPAASVRENVMVGGNTVAGNVIQSEADDHNRNASGVVRRNTNVTNGVLGTVQSAPASHSSGRNDDFDRNDRYGRNDRDHYGDRHYSSSRDYYVRDHNVIHVHPRERDFVVYSNVGSFYGHNSHCFGYRVEVLPPRYKVVTYYGVNYYCYNDVYYRPYNGHYVVCRPPFGVTLASSIVNLALSAVNFSYYTNVYRTYSAIDANNRYIDEQNRLIARNNATLAAQNSAIAMNFNYANDAYSVASSLGLVQSYAYANQEYYYQDGVFYIINPNGQYSVIVPPAGALVQSLPEDYATITLGGREYYRVDDTIYRMTLVSGIPYLEVLGQMYGSMANMYRQY